MIDHAHKLRRHARKIGQPAGDTPAVMRDAAAHIDDLECRLREAEGRVSMAVEAEREACARLCEKMAEARFADYGTREHDTGASYYRGLASEEYEARDEENNNCAAAIRSRSNSTATAAEPAIDAAMKSTEAGG